MRVIYRTFTGKDGGDVIAILPDVESNMGSVMTYQHIGQHGEGDYRHIVSQTRLATPDEYFALHRELEQVGYEGLKMRKRLQDRVIRR